MAPRPGGNGGTLQVRWREVVDRLTERQQEVLHLLAEGLSPQSVAEQLNITLNTVNSHKTIILADDARLNYQLLGRRFGHFVPAGLRTRL